MTTQAAISEHNVMADVEDIRNELTTRFDALEGWYELRHPHSFDAETTIEAALRVFWYDTMSNIDASLDKLTALVDNANYGKLQGKQPRC